MPLGRRVRERASSLTWLILACTACSCSSTSVKQAPADGGNCENLAGTWNVSTCDTSGQCTIAQQGCALSVVCATFLLGQETATGTVDADNFTLTLTSGTCTGTVSGTVLAGTCTTNPDPPCNFTGTRVP